MSEAAEQRTEGELAAAHAKRATLADASMKSKSRWLHGAHRASCNGGASRLNCGGASVAGGLTTEDDEQIPLSNDSYHILTFSNQTQNKDGPNL